MPNYAARRYPAFISLENQPVIVIGAGVVAERKVDSFLSYGAQVTVIAPQATDHVTQLASDGKVSWLTRSYRSGDLDGARLAVCACGVPRVDVLVHAEAQERNCLVNVVDVPDLCDFIVPAIVDRGPLQIAISTSGAAPTVARRIKREIADAYGSHWERYLLLLGELRGLVMARVPGGEEARRPLFEACAASDLETRVAAGEDITAEDAYKLYIAPLTKGEQA